MAGCSSEDILHCQVYSSDGSNMDGRWVRVEGCQFGQTDRSAQRGCYRYLVAGRQETYTADLLKWQTPNLGNNILGGPETKTTATRHLRPPKYQTEIAIRKNGAGRPKLKS